MKKALIAGAASVALAAMPIAGVFAADTTTVKEDTLTLSIAEVCTFTRNATAHGTGADNPTGGAWGASNNTYSASVAINTSYAALATSSFDIACNDPDGYQVTVGTTGFTATGVSGDDYAWAYAAGGSLSTDGQSMWTLDSGSAAGKNLANNIVLKRTAMPAGGTDSFTVTYGAYVDNNQPAGTYTATASYTFAQLPTA